MSINLRDLALRDLYAITLLARHRHFGRAAREAGITQPSLSALVRRVESALGKTLFHRTSRRCDISEAGVVVVETFDRMLKDLDGLTIPAGATVIEGPLRLGFIPTLGPYLIPHLLGPVRKAFPEARPFFHEEQTAALVTMVREGKLDCAILSFPIESDGLVELPLFEEELVLAVPDGHPLAGREALALTDVARTELILMENGHCLRDQTIALCGRGELDVVPFHATGLETLRGMVGAGVGCAVFPALAALADTGPSPIRYLRFRPPEPGRTVGILARRDPERLRVARAFQAMMSSVPLTTWYRQPI
ncbi:MAG: LysR family transcriptional regulator [Gemmatimonadales bacterium]|mgnify:CR=1 FL=1|nr:LysR family transcriptional regulator [Gemmatimonadales bacterium]